MNKLGANFLAPNFWKLGRRFGAFKTAILDLEQTFPSCAL